MLEESRSKTFELYRIAYSLIFCRSINEVMEVATTQIAMMVQAREAILWQFSAENRTLSAVHIHLQTRTVKTRSVSVGADYLGAAMAGANIYW
jgi:hypothetical protein